MDGKFGKKSDYEDSLDKTKVLQEAKQCFINTSVKTKKLIAVLTKCITMIMRGERLASNEATDLFFHITRLFQYKGKDGTLRRLIYIGIKILSHQADNVYVVTSSLITDVNSSRDDPAIRAAALRALCQISDATTFASIERYLKQCIVDKHPVVASAAICSLLRVAKTNSDIVRRCTNEIQEALNSDSPMVQYHALILRYFSCKNDRLAVSRLISNCIQQGLRSPHAITLLITIIANYLNENDGDREKTKAYRQYIKNQLLFPTREMIEYEAANALVNINNVSNETRRSAIAHLKSFLNSSKPALRYAAVRSLNKLATTSPEDVRDCNLDLERLISESDCNRSIAILAITTLLKTGTENSVEKFLKQIGEFLSEIDDEFKVVVVGSVRQLCQKYPSKHPAMMDFLSNMLREEGGYTYKKAIVDTIIKMIEDNESTKEKGLEQLCEFIEDCEHTSLAVEVLNLLGREGPKTNKATRFIRFIANRLLLDSPSVACAATSALAKFGVVPELSETIKLALARFSLHDDHEVMERALFYKNILEAEDQSLHSKFITNPTTKMNFADLEIKLMQYLDGDFSKPFDVSKIASVTVQDAASEFKKRQHEPSDDLDDISDSKPVASPREEGDQSPLPAIESFANIPLGELIQSTHQSVALTDSVSEFQVLCIMHIYDHHLVFQFNVTNTVNNMLLENVSIEMIAPEGFVIQANTECPKIAFEQTASTYTCVHAVDENAEMAHFRDVALKFNYKLVDPDTNEVDDDELGEDTFPIEDFRADLINFEIVSSI